MLRTNLRNRIMISAALGGLALASAGGAQATDFIYSGSACQMPGQADGSGSVGVTRNSNALTNGAAVSRTVLCPLTRTNVNGSVGAVVLAKRATTTAANPLSCFFWTLDGFGNITNSASSSPYTTAGSQYVLLGPALPVPVYGNAIVGCTLGPGDSVRSVIGGGV